MTKIDRIRRRSPIKEKRGWGSDVCVRGGAWVGLLVNERTVTAGKGEAVGEWRGGGGVCCVFVRVGGGGG